MLPKPELRKQSAPPQFSSSATEQATNRLNKNEDTTIPEDENTAVPEDENVEEDKLVENVEDSISTFSILDSTTAEVTGFVEGKKHADIVIPHAVVIEGKEYNVTSIGLRAFQRNQLTSVVIPDSVTSIGLYAFHKNPNLKTVSIPSKTTLGGSVFKDTHEDLVITYR